MDTATLTFEAAYQLLQETVERLEDGGLPLEEALALYEQGMQLTALCTAHLQQAQVRILQIDAALAEMLGPADETGDEAAEPDW